MYFVNIYDVATTHKVNVIMWLFVNVIMDLPLQSSYNIVAKSLKKYLTWCV